MRGYKVTRYRTPHSPDRLEVRDAQSGEVLLDVTVGPNGPLHTKAGDPKRPWFFTGSPFGAELLALAEARGVR